MSVQKIDYSKWEEHRLIPLNQTYQGFGPVLNEGSESPVDRLVICKLETDEPIYAASLEDRHLETALQLLNPNEEWVTLGALTALRQSIRESVANGWEFDVTDYLKGKGFLTLKNYRKWMEYAMHRDKIHHGDYTFCDPTRGDREKLQQLNSLWFEIIDLLGDMKPPLFADGEDAFEAFEERFWEISSKIDDLAGQFQDYREAVFE